MRGPATPRSILHIATQYLPSVVVPAAANILLFALFGRRLGSTQMGEYYLAQSVISIGSILSGGWLQQSIVRYESGIALAHHQRLHLRFFAAVPATALVFAAVVFAIRFFGLTSAPLTLVIIGLVITETWFRLLLSILQSQFRSLLYSSTTSFFAVGRLVLALVFFELGTHDARCLLYAWLAVQLATCLLLFGLLGYHRIVRSMETAAVTAGPRAYVRYGLPMLGFMLLTELRPFTDRLILVQSVDASAVGIHGSNYALGINSVGLLASPLMLAVHPYLMSIANREGFDSRDFSERTSELARMYLKLSMFLLAGAVPASHFISRFVLGSGFDAYYPIFSLACLGSVLGGLAIYLAKGLEARGRTMTLLRCNLVAYVISAVAAGVCVQLFGLIGASMGYVIGFAAYALIAWSAADRDIRPTFPLAELGALAVVFAMSSLIAELFGGSWITVVIGVLFAGALLLVFYVRGDIARLRSIAHGHPA